MDSYYVAYLIGTLVGALVAGALLGLIPLILGRKKGKNGLAIGGFAACVVSGLLLGAVLAVPVCIVFVVLILVLKDKNTDTVNREFVSVEEMPADYPDNASETASSQE